MGETPKKAIRRQACKAQGGFCFYCHRKMGRSVTAEHLVARCDGGKTNSRNIVATCAHCNHGRHTLFPGNAPDPETYQAYVLLNVAAGLWHNSA